VAIPPLETLVELYESLAEPVRPAEIAAGVLNTRRLSESEAINEIKSVNERLDFPFVDPVRFNASKILKHIYN
jgi:uncharacterized NAD-dependent epimerase/dehydratase family protein